MEVLPIHILDHDREGVLFGEDVINLSKLIRNDFPTLKGLVVTPPEIIINTVLSHLQKKGMEVFVTSLTLIQSEVNQIPIPTEFSKEFSDGSYLLNGMVIKGKNSLWKILLDIWLTQLKNKILREGLSKDLKKSLTSQIVFKIPLNEKKLLAGKFNLVTAFYDPNSLEVEIISGPKISPGTLKQIDQLVLLGNKKIFIAQIYHFLITDNLYLIKVSPFTQSLPGSEKEELVLPKREILQIKKSAVKVFWDLSSGFTTPSYMDGILIDGSVFEDLNSLTFKVSESALNFPHKPLILKLPNIEIKNYLEHLELLFNQKYLQNIEICLPNIHTPFELGQIKQQLVSLNPPRLWVEFLRPDNFLNFENFTKYKFDGILINLDLLQKSLLGIDLAEENFDKTQVRGLINFLKPYLKIFHQDKKLILSCGRLSLHPEMIDFLVEGGVWGVVSNNLIEAHSLPEHLGWVEERMVRKRAD